MELHLLHFNSLKIDLFHLTKIFALLFLLSDDRLLNVKILLNLYRQVVFLDYIQVLFDLNLSLEFEFVKFNILWKLEKLLLRLLWSLVELYFKFNFFFWLWFISFLNNWWLWSYLFHTTQTFLVPSKIVKGKNIIKWVALLYITFLDVEHYFQLDWFLKSLKTYIFKQACITSQIPFRMASILFLDIIFDKIWPSKLWK